MHFTNEFISPFLSWKDCFQYIGEHANDKREVIILDEFPFIALSDQTIKSVLQHTIDHNWKNKNIFLIICGSSISFMENELLAEKTPLYGRATSKLELIPFDYYESSLFFEPWSNVDKLVAYGILGGIPFYLNCFDPSLDLKQNIANNILKDNAILREEPQYL